MPVRYRRNRLLIILCLSTLVVLYWTHNNSNSSTDDEKKPVGRVMQNDETKLIKEPIKISQTAPSSTRLVREELVEINGKKLKKIDWHDYEAIAREDARNG